VSVIDNKGYVPNEDHAGAPGLVEEPEVGCTTLPLWNRFSLSGPPHCSVAFPVHAMSQSPAAAAAAEAASALPQSSSS
jgi:hypothetical protein